MIGFLRPCQTPTPSGFRCGIFNERLATVFPTTVDYLHTFIGLQSFPMAMSKSTELPPLLVEVSVQRYFGRNLRGSYTISVLRETPISFPSPSKVYSHRLMNRSNRATPRRWPSLSPSYHEEDQTKQTHALLTESLLTEQSGPLVPPVQTQCIHIQIDE
ncbi:hypothetical protein BJX99DRAFT_222331 [Aspergillus californicus]